MVICADHGLCNRLRAILSYREMARREQRRLVVVWQRDQQCNGEFLDCFAPIDGVRFVREPPSWAPAPPRVNHAHHAILGTEAEVSGYALLHPSPSVRTVVDARVRECTPYVAVHIRRTDMSLWAGIEPNSRYVMEVASTNARFDEFLEEAHPGLKVYVATDCSETHGRFASRYAARMRAPPPDYQPQRHRQTSLMDAAVDLFACAEARHFMGSYGSSFSDAILHLRTVRGRTSVGDRHDVAPDQDWDHREWAGPALRTLRVPTR